MSGTIRKTSLVL